MKVIYFFILIFLSDIALAQRYGIQYKATSPTGSPVGFGGNPKFYNNDIIAQGKNISDETVLYWFSPIEGQSEMQLVNTIESNNYIGLFGLYNVIDNDLMAVREGRSREWSFALFELNYASKTWGYIKNFDLSLQDIQELNFFEVSFSNDFALSGDQLVIRGSIDEIGLNEEFALFIFNRNEGGENNWGLEYVLREEDLNNGTTVRAFTIDSETIYIANTSHVEIFRKNLQDSWDYVTSTSSPSGIQSSALNEGISLVVDGQYLFYGAKSQDKGVTSPNQAGVVINAGAIYVFEQTSSDPEEWTEIAILQPSDQSASIGNSNTFSFDNTTLAMYSGERSQNYSIADSVNITGRIYVTENFGQDYDIIFPPIDKSYQSSGFSRFIDLEGDYIAATYFENSESSLDQGILVYKKKNLSITQSRLNFESIDLGSRKSGLLTLTNDTDNPITVSDFEITGDFSLEIESTTIESDNSFSLEITFEPTFAGNHEGTLTFIDNLGDSYSLDLIGSSSIPSISFTNLFSEVVSPSYVNLLYQLTTSAGKGVPNYSSIELYDLLENNSPISLTESLPQIGSLEDIPITIKTVLLLDNSFSVGLNLVDVKNAAIDFVNNKFDEQEIAIYSFSETISLVQDFTDSKSTLINSINSIGIGPASTNLYGAVIEGMNSFESSYTIDGIVDGFTVLFTDGEDTQGLNSLNEALAARGNKKLFAVGVGQSVDTPTLTQLQNSGLFTPSDFDELPAVFQDIQDDISDYARSFYWLTYISPKRGDNNHTLRISLKGNPNSGSDSFIQTNFNSNGFSPVPPGIYINRSFENLNGISEFELTSDDQFLNAETLFGFFTPEYVWSTSNSSIVDVAEDSVNSVARLSTNGSLGESATITIVDLMNTPYTKDVVVTIGELFTSNEVESKLSGFSLYQNYPNPFNPSTQINYSIPSATTVKLDIFNSVGQRVTTLVNEQQIAGNYSVQFDASSLSSGVYFYTIRAGDFVETRKMLLIK